MVEGGFGSWVRSWSMGQELVMGPWLFEVEGSRGFGDGVIQVVGLGSEVEVVRGRENCIGVRVELEDVPVSNEGWALWV